jgi:hypothetical protein
MIHASGAVHVFSPESLRARREIKRERERERERKR